MGILGAATCASRKIRRPSIGLARQDFRAACARGRLPRFPADGLLQSALPEWRWPKKRRSHPSWRCLLSLERSAKLRLIVSA